MVVMISWTAALFVMFSGAQALNNSRLQVADRVVLSGRKAKFFGAAAIVGGMLLAFYAYSTMISFASRFLAT